MLIPKDEKEAGVIKAVEEATRDAMDLLKNGKDDKFVRQYLIKYTNLIYLRNNLKNELLHIQYFMTNKKGRDIMNSIIKYVDSLPQ